MTTFYCPHCDKSFNNKFKQKHIKSKKHLYMYNNIVINKYNTGDVYFSNLEDIINEYIMEYNTKFNSFSILVKCGLYGENINISINNRNEFIPLCKFKDIGSVFYEYSQSKKIKGLCISICTLAGYRNRFQFYHKQFNNNYIFRILYHEIEASLTTTKVSSRI